MVLKCDVCDHEYEENWHPVAKFTLDGFKDFCPACTHRVKMAALYECYNIRNEIDKKK